MSLIRTGIVTVGGLGFLRPAPGTWGSLPPVALALAWLGFGLPIDLINFAILIVGVIAAAGCLEFGGWAESRWGKKDASHVVADETAGQSLAMLFLPWREIHIAEDWVWNLALALVTFLLFRAADILKPPPADSMQKLPGGQGILIDDLIAGFYAACAAQVIGRLLMQPVLDVVI